MIRASSPQPTPRAQPLAAGLALASLGVALAVTSPAQGQGRGDGAAASSGVTAGEESTVLFVPPLSGALVLGAGVHSRLGLDEDPAISPGTMAQFAVGYRHYLEDRGAVALGASLYGGFNLPSEPRAFQGFGARVDLQLRGMSPDYIFALAGIFVEGGALLAPPRTTRTPDGAVRTEDEPGLRFAVGIEGGFGFLTWLDPYVMAESGIGFSFERLDFGGRTSTAVMFSYQARLDWTWR